MSDKKVNTFFDRDLSWLSFNGRVLEEAERSDVPLKERLNFLSIFSSNLDEFYRVRMPALLALHRIDSEQAASSTVPKIKSIIHEQQERFGAILTEEIIPELAANQIVLLLKQPIPEAIKQKAINYFFDVVAGYIELVEIDDDCSLFPENNRLYLAAITEDHDGHHRYYILNVPSDKVARFYAVEHEGQTFVLFLEDVIKLNLNKLFHGVRCLGCYSFKITRDAELDLKDEFEGNLARKIETEIAQRDKGRASRFLYDVHMPDYLLKKLQHQLQMKHSTFVRGGTYHNLKDLSSLPVTGSKFSYTPWPKNSLQWQPSDQKLLDHLQQNDILLHPPYQNYDVVLRFFNEAAIDVHVTRIYATLYRVATESRIVNALISAANNGKRVTVFVELKARFDEANNIKWAKRMKAAGVQVLYSIPTLKVHAKVALVKRKIDHKTHYCGILSTGNFNESTARFYTDHVLLTGNRTMLREAEKLFRFLRKGRKRSPEDKLKFKTLLVAQFNLQERFIALIDREIDHATQGLKARIDIKLNNLEDRVLISKLYDASRAGVEVRLIVRSICCLIPGVAGMSDNITVTRIVDRYLEHGRLFIFHNNNSPDVILGSADWMNRNIYRRIEVCFPIADPKMKRELIEIFEIQRRDNTQAVRLDSQLQNREILNSGDELYQSQKEISFLLDREAEKLIIDN